jgi:hypothetical protein
MRCDLRCALGGCVVSSTLCAGHDHSRPCFRYSKEGLEQKDISEKVVNLLQSCWMPTAIASGKQLGEVDISEDCLR